MIELQLGMSAVGGRAPYLIHHIERISGLVETALDVQVSSSISTDDAAEVGKSVCVMKLFVINLDWSCVGSVLCSPFFRSQPPRAWNRLFLGMPTSQVE